MRCAVAILAAFGWLLSGSASAETAPLSPFSTPQIYRSQPESTSVAFHVRHFPLSTFTGQFDRFEAFFVFDDRAPEKIEFLGIIDITSFEPEYPPPIDVTGPDWFALEDYPTSHFYGARMVMTGPDTAVVHGEVTMRGITHPALVNIEFLSGAPLVEPYPDVFKFQAEMTVDRTKFGMTKLRRIVRREIDLTFEGQLTRENGREPRAPRFPLPPVAGQFLGSVAGE